MIEANNAEKSSQWDRSLALYTEATTTYMAFYKQCNDTEKKKGVLKVIEVCITRAEAVKERKVEESRASTTSSSNRIISSSSTSAIASSVLNFTKQVAHPSSSSSASTEAENKAPVDTTDYSAAFTKEKEEKTKRKAATHTNLGRPVPSKISTANGSATTPNVKGAAGKGAKLPATTEGQPKNEYETQILSEMLDSSPKVTWDDIAGLAFAKQTLQEAVILPNLRPDLFTGLRAPPKGVLLFGPPGTGKTLLAKAVATESQFAFFSITASSLTSKYLGEGEKLMKALFEVARMKQPAVIFFDEIDALMSTRKDGEHEASRRMKTEFMTQLDGATTSSDKRLLIMAATNIPWDLDEAVLRRMVKRVYVPLPDEETRSSLIKNMLKKQVTALSVDSSIGMSSADLSKIVKLTDGYSASDLTAVCQEAAMGPIRELGPAALRTVKEEDVRKVNLTDFATSLRTIRPSVSPDSLHAFTKWADSFGTSR